MGFELPPLPYDYSWTSSHFVVLTLVLSLIVLGGVSLGFHFSGQGKRSRASNCGGAVSDSRAYEAAVTRDLRSRVLLLADTQDFARHLRAHRDSTCAPARRTIVTAESNLSTICPACTGTLRRTFDAVAAA